MEDSKTPSCCSAHYVLLLQDGNTTTSCSASEAGYGDESARHVNQVLKKCHPRRITCYIDLPFFFNISLSIFRPDIVNFVFQVVLLSIFMVSVAI